MEDKVHNYLSLFLTHHDLKDSISQIDGIVLSYLIGILELISQGEVDDCFDLEDVTEMMNAYLPGFDKISRDSVLKWMFDLAAHLREEDPLAQDIVETSSKSDGNDGDECKVLPTEDVHTSSTDVQTHSTFPCYDFEYSINSGLPLSSPLINGKESIQNESNGNTVVAIPQRQTSYEETPLSSPPLNSSATTLAKQEKQRRKSGSKRKERYLSCSSQESQEDTASKHQVETQIDSDDSRVRSLLEMFPAACTMEVTNCLQVSDGDLDLAAQLIMDRQETGQAITHSKCYQKRDRKMKKGSDYKLDDSSIKSTVLERYSFIDTEEDKKTYKPPPLKNEAKKLVRYRNGQIVSMKGERFTEVKRVSSDDSSQK